MCTVQRFLHSILKEVGCTLLQKTCNTLLAIREREAAVIRGPLNLQPRIQHGSFGLAPVSRLVSIPNAERKPTGLDCGFRESERWR